MKYVIKKAIQVKGFTRTRKGKMELVKPYSRAVNKFVENLTKLPTSLLEKLIPSTDPQAKWRDKFVIAELDSRKKLGEPYYTRRTDFTKPIREYKYLQPKEGAIEKIDGKWKIAKKVMVEVKREKWEPEVQWTDPTPEDIPAIKARALQRAETIAAGHQAKYKSATEARELEQAKKEMAGAKTKEGIYEVLKKWGTALYRKKIVGEPYYTRRRRHWQDKEEQGGDYVPYDIKAWAKWEESKGKKNKEEEKGKNKEEEKPLGEPYEVKEHTKDEYKRYLDSLTTDERELELEKWKLRLGLEVMSNRDVGEPYRHIEIDVKPGTKRTKDWKIKEAYKENSNTINSPKYLNPKIKKDINGELHDISKRYHAEFPIDEIFDILTRRGIVVLQEDNTKFEGFFLGENAQTFFPIAPVGSENNEFYTPFKNTALAFGWYKMPSGNYEVTTYLG